MFYVILTIVILVVFATIFSAPKQQVQTGGYINITDVITAVNQLNGVKQSVENLKTTIDSIAPELPEPTTVIAEIEETLKNFPKSFFDILDGIEDNIESDLKITVTGGKTKDD